MKLQQKVIDALWHAPSNRDEYLFYEKRDAIADPFFDSMPGDKWQYFYLGDLRYHGHDVDIIWKKDWDDDRPGNQSKLYVWIDSKRVAESDLLNQPLTVRLP